MAAFYLQIKLVHLGAVILSGSLFALRGALTLAGSRVPRHAAVRYVSYAIDTVLLTAALMLTTIVHQYPFVQAWLTVKVLLLAVYIVLGTVALKRGRSARERALAYVAALAVFAFIVSVARAHQPLGALAALLR